jgi:hypothetical protein
MRNKVKVMKLNNKSHSPYKILRQLEKMTSLMMRKMLSSSKTIGLKRENKGY